jgi:methylase of polypeptide subunit release factors
MPAPARDVVLGAFLRGLRRLVDDGAPRDAVVQSLAAQLLHDAHIEAPVDTAAPAAPVDLPMLPAIEPAWLLGLVHEHLLDADARRRHGAHYTPSEVARRLVAFAREGHHVAAPRSCDPAVGGGAFLLAAAESLEREGLDRRTIVRTRCFGCDVDPHAVDVTRAALALWAGEWPEELAAHVVVRDSLTRPAWRHEFGFVVGNPPFQSQLGRTTARGRVDAETLKARFGAAVSPYVDSAALFLLAGIELLAPGGRLAFVQPHSTLVARDAEGVRRAVGEQAHIAGVWFARERVFDASVCVWAPVLERRADRTTAAVDAATGIVGAPLPRRIGAAVAPAPSLGDAAARAAAPGRSWAPLVADLTGIPEVEPRSDGCVRDLATATAGFRDQFYGLVGAVREGARDVAPARLITAGLVDPLDVAWGRRAARFAGVRYRCPVVDLDAVRPEVRRWVQAQLVPKVVVATQTKVVEAAVDECGDLVPSTPVIAVHMPPHALWHVVAALSAPPVTALAMRATLGSALSSDAVKLSARQVLDLPLPVDRAAWDTAATLARAVPATAPEGRREALAAFGAAACAAYDVAASTVLPWWLDRASGGV